MYKVSYYTFAKCKNQSIGNIIQYYSAWYTECSVENIPQELQKVIDAKKGINKYIPIITKIKKSRWTFVKLRKTVFR